MILVFGSSSAVTGLIRKRAGIKRVNVHLVVMAIMDMSLMGFRKRGEK